MLEFFLGIISSLVTTGLVAIFDPRFRFWIRKQYRIWKRAIRQSLHLGNIGASIVSGERTLNIGIALNGRSPYVVDMEQAFISEANYLLEREGILLHVERSLGSASMTEEGNKRALRALLSSFSNKQPDIIVSFGSGISSYVRRAYPGVPQIFVGVTDPISSGLCRSFEPDTARGDVCGVTFSVTAADRVALLREAFPHRRIGFVYNPSYAADIHHLEAFRQEVSKVGVPLNEISVTKPLLTDADQQDVDVLIGWLYLHENIVDFLKISKRPIIGGGWVDLRKGACCCIADDEREVGRLAASQILYDYVVNRVPLCQIPIQKPSGNVRQRLMIGLNLDAAGRFGISFPSNIVNLARFRIRERQ